MKLVADHPQKQSRVRIILQLFLHNVDKVEFSYGNDDFLYRLI